MFELILAVWLLLAAYPIAIYPLLVAILARFAPRPWKEARVDEPVAHLITVHNEEGRIGDKLENALLLEAPRGGLRTIVVDDGSDDGTRAVVASFAARGVEWIECGRVGKERAQLEAIRRTREPILVFSDASTRLPPEALLELIRPFADTQVGAVSGHDVLARGTETTGEDLYVRYEMAMRRDESLVGSLVGTSGCFFAVRRGVAERLKADVPSDLGAALVAVSTGGRAVAQPTARCSYTATPRLAREFARKRRTALRGMRCLLAYPEALSFRRLLVSWQIVSHKWLRFCIPLFLLLAVATVTSAAASGRGWARFALAAGVAAVGCALLAPRLPFARRLPLIRAPAFFLLGNAAVAAAWVDLLRSRESVTWVPTSRPGAER